jgi:hypothetical protein
LPGRALSPMEWYSTIGMRPSSFGGRGETAGAPAVPLPPRSANAPNANQ